MRFPLLALAAALAAGPPPPGVEAPAAQRAVRQGIAVELTATGLETAGGLSEGKDATFRFRITDPAGLPLSGVRPAAWAEPLRGAAADAASDCTAEVEKLVSGSLLSRPEVDLNTYYVLALNDDASVSVVDPLFGFGGSQLLTLIGLDSPGEDWALSADRTRLFVSQPAAGRVAVIDTASFQRLANLPVGPGAGRLALQPDGARLWVALEDGVAAVDTRDLAVTHLATGRGPHDLAVSDDSRLVFVTNREAGTLSLIDTAGPARLADLPVGAAPAAVAFSPLAQAAYVTSEEGGAIVAVDGRRREVVARLAADPGVRGIGIAPGGRLGFAVNPRGRRVYVFDTSLNRVVQTAAVDGEPDQVTFSSRLAYLRLRGSDAVLMVPLDRVGEEGAAVPVADFPAGQNPPGKGRRPSLASSIVQAPGEDAVLVANPADRSVYYYREGMAAPMGSFSNYGREPRSVLVVDRSLRERAPGVYEAIGRPRHAGRYRVAFFLDAPRTVQCFAVTVAEDPVLAERRRRERPVAVEPLIADRTALAGQPFSLRFRLTDPDTGGPADGLEDVTVLAFRAPGTWSVRQTARRVEAGVYEVRFAPPRAGSYYVSIQCPSRHLPFNRTPQVVLEVKAPAGR